MRKPDNHRSARGITLIEALVALAIVSIGLLAIARLHGELMANAGDSKARAEAVQVIESEVEKLRNAVTFDDLLDRIDDARNTPPYEGKNATITLTWDNLPTGSNFHSFDPSVTAQWTDRRGNPQSITLDSTVTWTNPRTSVAIADADGNGGNFVERPTGRARMGGDDILEGADITTTTNVIEGTTLEDGTEMRSDGEGTVQLVRDGEVLMTMETTNPGEVFSTVSGRFYFSNNINVQLTRVLTSDAGLCTRRGNELAGQPVEPFVDASSGYKYFYYQCYIGEGWYGNVGVVRLDSAANQDRICVGDHTAAETAAWDSREARLSTIRRYRAFVEDGSGGYVAVGMGREPAQADSENPSYVAQTIAGHHFMSSHLTGQANCESVLEASEGAFIGNAGRNYCLHPDGVGCGDDTLPDDSDAEPTVITKVVGDINYGVNNTHNEGWTVSAIQFDGGTCVLDRDAHPQSEAIVSFTCNIDREGWTGGDWFGDMTLTHGGALCSFSQTFVNADTGNTEGSAERTGNNTIHFKDVVESEMLELNEIRIREEAGDC